MFIHSILQGFINTGLDDYIVKSLSPNSRLRPLAPNQVLRPVRVHNPRGEDYYANRVCNVDTPAASHSRSTNPKQPDVSSSKSSSKSNTDRASQDSKPRGRRLPPGTQQHPSDPNKTIPAGIPDSLKREVIPGVCLCELIGPNETDEYLAESFPEFHGEYPAKLLGKRTGTGMKIVLMDFTHFPERIQQRGFILAKDSSEYKKHLKNLDTARVGVEKQVAELPDDLQNQLTTVTPKQSQLIAQHIRTTLLHPAFTMRGNNHLTPQGSTVYVSWDCCVTVINLPNKECVVKSFYPINADYKFAIENGWDGSIPLEEFRNKKEY